MQQPGAMRLPFRWTWWSFDLGEARPCDSTYCRYPYASLPPLPALDGSLRWLGPLDQATDQKMQVYRNAPEARGKVDAIGEQARGLGLTLPAAFTRLMGSPELQDRIPSCTACYFELADKLERCPGTEDGYTIGFLNDQQDVLLWYLYLTPRGEEAVLVASYPLEELTADGAGHVVDDRTRSAALANTFACATSFEAFIYRFWLENMIWFKLNETGGRERLTEEERRYLAQVRQGRTAH